MFSKIENSTTQNHNSSHHQIQQRHQWRNGVEFPDDFDFFQGIIDDIWQEKKKEQNHKKPKKQQQKNKKQKNEDDKKFNYMPVVAVQAIQSFEKDTIEFSNSGNHGINSQEGKIVFQIFTKLMNDVLLKNKKIRRNKRFLRMIFNDVDEELNETIRNGKMTRAEEEYFWILDDYDHKLVNSAKSQLRFAFERAMTERRIELFAMNKVFRVGQDEKRKHLLNYLMKIKFELGKGEISGSVDGKEVEDVLHSEEKSKTFIGCYQPFVSNAQYLEEEEVMMILE